MSRERVKLRSLGKKIKWLRQNKHLPGFYGFENDKTGFTQQEFADLLNVSVDTVKNWEQGYNYPSLDWVVELCSIFGCDFDFLLGDQETPNKYAGLSIGASKALFDAYESNDPVCKIVSELLEQGEILRQILRLISVDYEHLPVISEIVTLPGTLSISSLLTKKDVKNGDVMRLFLLLWSYVNSEREKNGLEKLDFRI